MGHGACSDVTSGLPERGRYAAPCACALLYGGLEAAAGEAPSEVRRAVGACG